MTVQLRIRAPQSSLSLAPTGFVQSGRRLRARVAPPYIVRDYAPETLAWIARQTKKDGDIYLGCVDRLIKKGKGRGWWDAFAEIMIYGSDTPQASMEGLKGFITNADITLVGDIGFIPRFGAVRTSLSENSYINLNKAPLACPGVTETEHTIAMYVTTNFLGSYQEFGSSGTAGKLSLMLRACSGFRSGMWLASGQIIYGGTSGWGFHMGSRQDANAVWAWRQQLRTTHTAPIGAGLSTNPLTVLSAEPSSSNSPNQVLMVAIGGAVSPEVGDAFAEDFIQFVREIGIYDDIEVPAFELGPNCFGPLDYQSIIPADFRVARQAVPPASLTTPASLYNYYPYTDLMANRSWIEGNVTKTLGVDPIATTNGSTILTITTTSHGMIDTRWDTVQISGVVGGNGIDAALINKRHKVLTCPTANTYTIDVGGTAASGTGAIGGSTITVLQRTFRIRELNFLFPRSGALGHMVWSHRGERDVAGGPITSGTLKPNDIGAAVKRLFDDPITGIKSGQECRPAFSTKPLAIAATLAIAAHIAGYDETNDPDDPLGEGWRDIWENRGGDPAKLIPFWQAYVGADDLFTLPLTGYAVCYDYCILQPGRIADITGIPASRKRLDMDDEHADRRSGAVMLEFMTRFAQIAAAKGMKARELGHQKMEPQTTNLGFTLDNAHVILNDPNWECLNLITSQPFAAPGVPLAHIINDQAIPQVNFFKGPAGDIPVPMEKFLVSCTLGSGKNRIDDPGPFAQQQVTIENCALVRDWMQANGIKQAHVRRVGATEGGEIERVVNQQLITYFPNLGTAPPIPTDGAGIVQAWVDQINLNDGESVSDIVQTALINCIQSLIDDGLWAKTGMFNLLATDTINQALRDVHFNTLKGATFGAPVHTALRHVAFDGVDDHILTAYTPGGSGDPLTGTSQEIHVYERTNVGVNSTTTAGAFAGTTNNALHVSARGSTNKIQARASCSQVTTVGNMTDSRGLTSFGRRVVTGADVFTFWKNGVLFETIVPTTIGAALNTTRPFAIGASNSAGTINSFRACSVAFVGTTSGLDATEHANYYAAIQAMMTELGANV